MSRELVQTAEKLLAKAQSTTSDQEAIALVERSYALLAKAINTYDQEHPEGTGGARRRERRRLQERRRRAKADGGDGARREQADIAEREGDSIARYRGTADSGYSWRRRLDVKL